MATQTFYSAYVGNLRSYIVVNEKSQDVAGNRTLISYSVYADKRYSHNPYNNFNQTPVQVTINGTRVYNANVNYDLQGRTTQLIASGETYVTHNNDGTKALTVSMSVDFSSTGTSFGYGKTSVTGSMNLTTIPRASTFSLSSYSFDFATNIAMTINRNDSSFTHNVKYTQPNGTETSLSTTATTSATLNIPISLATQIPNTTSYVSKITVQTKNSSGTVIGSNTTNVTVVLNEKYKPSISVLNPTGANATIGNNTTSTYQYLGGVDKVGTTITASGSNGSTISFTQYRLLNNSGTQVSTITANGTGKATFTAPTVPSTNQLFTLQARVADSRGRYSDWKSASIKIRSHYYKKPSIWNVTVGRSTSNQNYMVGRVSWEVVPVYAAGGTAFQINTASMKFRYRKKGVTSWTDLTTSTTLSTTNYALPFNNTVFAQSDTFEFMGEITDKFGNKSQTAIVTVNGSFVHMDFGPKGVGIGKDHSDSNYDLEIGAGGMSIDGGIQISGTGGNVSPVAALYNPSGGALIDIMHSATVQMITVEVIGNSYGVNIPINSTFQTYHYTPVGNFLNTSQLNNGFTIPQGRFFIHNNRIKLWLPVNSSYQTYIVRAYGMNGSVLNPKIESSTMPTSGITGDVSYCAVRQVSQMNENDVKTLMAGSVSNFNSSSWLNMIKESLNVDERIFADMVSSNSIIWCRGQRTAGVPKVDGLLMSFSIDSTQRTQIYFGSDNKLYQRQRNTSGVWGAWSSGR